MKPHVQWTPWFELDHVSNPSPPATTVDYTDWGISTAGYGDDSLQYRIVAHRIYNDVDYFSTPIDVSILYSTIFWKIGHEIETVKQHALSLRQNIPNPFNPLTRIGFTLPAGGKVSIKVFDVLGREVKVLLEEWKGSGDYEIPFDAADLPSGVYYYQLQHKRRTLVQKMLLMK